MKIELRIEHLLFTDIDLDREQVALPTAATLTKIRSVLTQATKQALYGAHCGVGETDAALEALEDQNISDAITLALCHKSRCSRGA